MNADRLALVCDDHTTRLDHWKEIVQGRLGDGWDVEEVGGEQLAKMISALGTKEAASREGQDADELLGIDEKRQLALLDAADLVLFDSDLTPSIEDSKLIGPDFSRTLRNQMGDTVARQIRSFTSAGFIVVVNMFWGHYPGPRVFDLTMMQGWQSHADLHISEAELEDDALWDGVRPEAEEYHPWVWPALATAHEFVQRSEAAVGGLDDDVLTRLGLDFDRFSPRQSDLFGANGAKTFRQLTTSVLGFRYTSDGAHHSDQATRRMAASVLRRWVARTLVAGQNVVSDGPHLLARLSPLLGTREENVDAWNAATVRSLTSPDPIPAASSARMTELEAFADRPLWDVQGAKAALAGLSQDWQNPPSIAFAEDRSTFVDEDDVFGFESDLPGPYTRRYVAQLDEVDYEPAGRLLQ